MGLKFYIGKRVVYGFVLLLFVIGLNFILFQMMPTDPIQLLLGGFSELDPEQMKEQRELVKEAWGLGEPLYVRFAKYVRNLFTWRLGRSMWEGRPVSEAILMRLPYTLELMGTSQVFAIIIGVCLGVYAAKKRESVFDSVTLTGSLILYSLPVFWLGMIFIMVFAMQLDWLPMGSIRPKDWSLGGEVVPHFWNFLGGQVSEGSLNLVFSINPGQALELVGGYLRHLFLPCLTLLIFQYGGYMLLTRATMLETLTEDYVVTARAKGVKEREVLFKHALKNASLPLITSVALAFGFMISGATITETVFNWPGLGKWVYDGIQLSDYPVIMGFFYIIAICVIIANLMADLLYGIIDPRVKYG